MKKRMTMLALLVGLVNGSLRAQSLAQDIEQLALDYQKLAEMKHTLSSMYKAYAELHQGFEQVKSIAEGNFNLHKAYLDGLLAVSPIVRDYPKVVRIIDNEAALVKEYQSESAVLGGAGFSSGTLDYFNSLYENLLTSSLYNLEELAIVLTDGELRMSDAERLSAIDRIDLNMTRQLGFLRSFNGRAGILAGQMSVERNDINTMRGLNGIGN
jgi:hypothetical protein